MMILSSTSISRALDEGRSSSGAATCLGLGAGINNQQREEMMSKQKMQKMSTKPGAFHKETLESTIAEYYREGGTIKPSLRKSTVEMGEWEGPEGYPVHITLRDASGRELATAESRWDWHIIGRAAA